MKLAKSILLGSAVGLIGVAGAQAADLPSRKSAPIQYVRICDAYGAGFFYIPGTDTCLKIGGLVVAEARSFDARFGVPNSFAASGTPIAPNPNLYNIAGTQNFTQARARDTYGYGALGRIELDARTATAWGTLRTFVRADAYYGGGTTAATGAFTYAGSTVASSTAQPIDSRYTTLLNKAFIQFGGLTAGYAQSMFDFYADAYNFETLRGSNATSALFAYTATFGGGFSGTISAEDSYSRRAQIGSVLLNTAGANGGNGVASLGSSQSTFAVPGGGRLPDLIANMRYDAPWGAVQLSGAAHYVTESLYQANVIQTAAGVAAGGVNNGVAGIQGGITSPPPLTTSSQVGFAAQLGVQFNLDQLAPGDKLWLQATYQKGAASFTEGGNLSFINGAPGAQRYPGTNPGFFNVGYAHSNSFDCVFTAAGQCDRQEGYAFVAAYKHYWIPTVSSSFYGSYYKVNNSIAALNTSGVGAYGANNYEEIRAGTNLIWTPVKGFDIGAEFFYFREIASGPSVNSFGASNQGVGTAGQLIVSQQLPRFTATQNVYEGRLRVQRAF